jgi:hypothetical protein
MHSDTISNIKTGIIADFCQTSRKKSIMPDKIVDSGGANSKF